MLKRFFFFKGMDTTKVVAVFESFADASGTNSVYYRILNKGKLRLMELKKVLVKENDYNPLSGKKEYSFYSRNNYAIADEEKLIPLKSLSARINDFLDPLLAPSSTLTKPVSYGRSAP